MTGTEGSDGLRVELDRVATRMQILGPRWAARSAVPEELPRVRAVLQDMADLAADAEGRSRRPVPELSPHALADQVLVLGQDLVEIPDPEVHGRARQVLQELRRSL